jgi:hypothetical protein
MILRNACLTVALLSSPFLVLAADSAPPAAVTAAPTGLNEPSGVGDLKLEAPVAEVEKKHPEMEKLKWNAGLGAAVVGGPHVERYVLRGYEVKNLAKPADVELRFWDGKLWVIIVYLGQNPADEVRAALEKQIGKPTAQGPPTSWLGKKSTTVLAYGQGYFSISDNGLSDQARQVMVKALGHFMQRRPGATPPPRSKAAAGTPAASR